jgi:S1-C subfamily serine protease
MTNAAVHSGASGGAVVSLEDGRMVGIVTSNAKHSGNLVPKINFSIPSSLLRPLVAVLAAAGDDSLDEQSWQTLDAADASLNLAWQLGSSDDDYQGGKTKLQARL